MGIKDLTNKDIVDELIKRFGVDTALWLKEEFSRRDKEIKSLREENKTLKIPRTVKEPFICFLCEQEAEWHNKYICEKIQHLDERIEDADQAMSCWCEWVKHDGKVCGVCIYREKYKEVI
ncbi:hypothetical protein N9948_01635 [bacterium]|nr:hypothetical protein [bacterium]